MGGGGGGRGSKPAMSVKVLTRDPQMVVGDNASEAAVRCYNATIKEVMVRLDPLPHTRKPVEAARSALLLRLRLCSHALHPAAFCLVYVGFKV